MQSLKNRFKLLKELLAIEQEEEKQLFLSRLGRYNVQERIEQGISWYPLIIKDWYFDKADRVIIEVERVKGLEKAHEFSSGRLVSFFSKQDTSEELPTVSGTILSMRANQAKVSLNSDDLPSWFKNGKIGMNLLYDETSYKEMLSVIKYLQKGENKELNGLIERVYGLRTIENKQDIEILDNRLNSSQTKAMNAAITAEHLSIIHGPPGTGKTTTLLSVIGKLVKKHPQILVCAPSNNALDLLVEKMHLADIKVLRMGNPARINEHIQAHSLSHKIATHSDFSLIKKLKKQSAEIRNLAGKYKRNFGPEERAQRKALYDEAWKLQKDAQQVEDYIVNDLIDSAEVIAATLVGSANHLIRDKKYPVCIIDEASQALEAATLIPIAKSKKVIMAGDHYQLPPTVKSKEAEKRGLSKSLFESSIEAQPSAANMLQTQYRMHEHIMGFSSKQFYKNELIADDSVKKHSLLTDDQVIEFIDTAGCDFNEESEKRSVRRSGSIFNFHEADLLWKYLYSYYEKLEKVNAKLTEISCGIISPYKAQVELLKTHLTEFPFPKNQLSVNTIDGFQGQERDIVFISLTRSNTKNEIGFLKDYRRMNVALTRAKKKLVVFGDSATLGKDKFYSKFLDHIEQIGGYRSAWEIMYEE